MLPSDYACPRCKCRACYALHRKRLDWIMTLFGLRPAKCLTCSKKFYARYKLSDDSKYILKGSLKNRPGDPTSQTAAVQSPGSGAPHGSNRGTRKSKAA